MKDQKFTSRNFRFSFSSSEGLLSSFSPFSFYALCKKGIVVFILKICFISTPARISHHHYPRLGFDDARKRSLVRPIAFMTWDLFSSNLRKHQKETMMMLLQEAIFHRNRKPSYCINIMSWVESTWRHRRHRRNELQGHGNILPDTCSVIHIAKTP